MRLAGHPFRTALPGLAVLATCGGTLGAGVASVSNGSNEDLWLHRLDGGPGPCFVEMGDPVEKMSPEEGREERDWMDIDWRAPGQPEVFQLRPGATLRLTMVGRGAQRMAFLLMDARGRRLGSLALLRQPTPGRPHGISHFTFLGRQMAMDLGFEVVCPLPFTAVVIQAAATAPRMASEAPREAPREALGAGTPMAAQGESKAFDRLETKAGARTPAPGMPRPSVNRVLFPEGESEEDAKHGPSFISRRMAERARQLQAAGKVPPAP